MQRRAFLRQVGAVSAVGITGLAGCSGDGGSDGDGATSTSTSTPENQVGMYTKGGSYYFDPIGLHVEPGETVTWVNEAGSHSTTAYEAGNSIASVTRIPDGGEAWNSETLTTRGATFQHTFETEGTYDYFCIPHKSFGMVGRIVVGDPGGPAEGSMPPDGDVPESSTIVEQGSVSYADFRG